MVDQTREYFKEENARIFLAWLDARHKYLLNKYTDKNWLTTAFA